MRFGKCKSSHFLPYGGKPGLCWTNDADMQREAEMGDTLSDIQAPGSCGSQSPAASVIRDIPVSFPLLSGQVSAGFPTRVTLTNTLPLNKYLLNTYAMLATELDASQMV